MKGKSTWNRSGIHIDPKFKINFKIDKEPIWNRYRIDLKQRCRLGIGAEPIWNRYKAYLEPIWYRYKINLKQRGSRLEIYLWNRFSINLETKFYIRYRNSIDNIKRIEVNLEMVIWLVEKLSTLLIHTAWCAFYWWNLCVEEMKLAFKSNSQYFRSGLNCHSTNTVSILWVTVSRFLDKDITCRTSH